MLWIFLALITAITHSLRDVFSKKGMIEFDEYVVAWFVRAFSAIMIFPYLLISGIPQFNVSIIPVLIIDSVLLFLSSIFYFKALKHSDISLTVPILAFSPMILIITSFFMNNEFPSMIGIFGILLIVFGAYTLNITKLKSGYTKPIKALFSHKGPRYMFVVVLMWSLTANFDKIGVLETSPVFWLVAVNTLSSMMLFVMIKKTNRKIEFKKSKNLMLIGTITGIGALSMFFAISITLVSYAVSIKRLSIVIGSILGFLIFKEKNIKERMLGILIMIAGVVLIALG